MRLPTLYEFPDTPTTRRGWPWTDARPLLPPTMPNGTTWPRITVVTTSYNQAEFLEETIRSVVLQGYPNLEYILIDGGSTDGSLDIIQKYSHYFAYWVSEKDRGQSHAINKGFEQSHGELLCWLNSDDVFEPDTLKFVAQCFPGPSNPAWLVGASLITDQTGKPLYVQQTEQITYRTLLTWPQQWFPQQSTFWTRRMWEKAGPLQENLYYTMDLALWLTMMTMCPPKITTTILSKYRLHDRAKCANASDQIQAELITVFLEFLRTVSGNSIPQVEAARLVLRQILPWAHDSYNRNHTIFRNDLLDVFKKYCMHISNYRSSLSIGTSEIGTEILFWARDSYHRKCYQQARRYLFSTFRRAPQLLFKKDFLSLMLRIFLIHTTWKEPLKKP